MKMQRVLITGGSRGIGEALVRAYCARGCLVAFTYLRSESAALALAKETGAQAYPCDTRSEDAVSALKEALLRRFHGLDALVINAGTSQSGCLEDLPLSKWEDIFDVHVRGAFLNCRAFLPQLRQSKGSIVLISSMWGQVGASCEVAYSSAKAALIGFAKALAKEVAPAVRVNAIAPGVIDTDMMRSYTDAERRALIEQTPLLRLGTPEDVASAALFLTGEGASFITGQVLGVSGGYVIV